MLFKISFIKFKRHLKTLALSSTVSACFWDFIILKFCDSYYMFHEPCFVNFRLLFFPHCWHTIITKKIDYQHLVVSWFLISIEFAFEWCNTLKLRKIHFRPVTFKIWRFFVFLLFHIYLSPNKLVANIYWHLIPNYQMTNG